MITQKIDLNLIPGRVLPRVNVSQYDKGTRTLEFTIYNGDVSFDPTSYTAYIQGFKPDGHGFNYPTTITSQKITADVTEQMTVVCGEVTCEVIIMDGTDRIGTGNFIMNVERAAMPDDAQMSDSDYAYIEQLIEDAQQAVEDAQAEVENAEAWANGTRDGQTIPATDPAYQKNSKYWSEQSSDYSEDAEAWANGTRDGQTIPSTDTAYHKNSKYWSEQSASYVEDAEAWAVGTRNGTPVPSGSQEYENNAAYWANEARNVAQQTTYTEMDDSLALAPTSAGNALARKIYGMSVQDGTPTPSSPVEIESASADFKCVGKNLNAYPYYQTTKTVNGITFTDNGDGTITVNGTASAYSSFTIHSRLQDEENDLIIANGNYIVTGCPNGGSTTTYRIQIDRTYNGTANSLGVDTGNGAVITLDGDDYSSEEVNLALQIQITSGTTCNNLVFKPMLRLASVADATYEPYKHTGITTSQTLRSIEVTSSDPYNLVKDGKYYIADTIDWDELDGYTLTKRVGHEAITTAGYYQDRGSNVAQFNVPIAGKAMFLVKGNRSNRFIADGSAPRENGEFYIDNSGSINAFVGFVQDASITSVATATTWLSNHETYVEYILATPTKTSLTSAQAKALLSMRTYDESTSIDAVNAPAPVLELEYAKTRTPALALTGHNMAHINAIDIGDM